MILVDTDGNLWVNRERLCSIPRPLKRVFFKTLLTILSLLTRLGRRLKAFGRFVFKPIFFVLKKTFRYIVLPSYRLSLRLKQKWNKSFGATKNKYLYPLIAKPILHIVVVLLIFSVTAVNLQARTLPSTGGEGSLLYSVMGGNELELIEETADQARSTKVTSYLGAAYGVGKQQATVSDVAIPVTDNQALVTTGGSAITSTPAVTGATRSSTSVQRKYRSGIETYIVQDGDTISTIASSFSVTSGTILWANNLGTRDYIRPSQELKILPVDGVLHTIKRGDTLSKLANSYGVTEDEIREYNNLSEEDILSINQELLIAGGTPARAAPATRLAVQPSLGNIGSVFNKPNSSSQAGTASMIWPTTGHVLTQYWGWRHTGVDIDGHYDSPIYAADSGVVEVSGWGRGYGIQAVINHENGYKTRYAHMSKVFVTVGQRVEQGEVIGMIGTTGYSTGTHLHFEVYVNGVRKNPLLYIR